MDENSNSEIVDGAPRKMNPAKVAEWAEQLRAAAPDIDFDFDDTLPQIGVNEDGDPVWGNIPIVWLDEEPARAFGPAQDPGEFRSWPQIGGGKSNAMAEALIKLSAQGRKVNVYSTHTMPEEVAEALRRFDPKSDA